MTSQNEEWYKAQEEMRNKLEDEWAKGQSNPHKTRCFHVEYARDCDAAHKYCEKGGDFLVKDTRKQGKRTDLDMVYEAMKAGATVQEIANEFPSTWIRYGRHIKKTRLALLQANPNKPYVIWHYGVTGAGKSRTVRVLAPNAAEIDQKNGFFSGYSGEEEVAWHSFDKSCLQYSKLLKLLDYGKQFVRVKRGHVKWRAKTVWFTSTFSPESMYPKSKRLLEMIDEIYYWKSKDEWIKIK